ncbi:hypothetical protein ACLOJK_015265 [Asimina triloba]
MAAHQCTRRRSSVWAVVIVQCPRQYASIVADVLGMAAAGSALHAGKVGEAMQAVAGYACEQRRRAASSAVRNGCGGGSSLAMFDGGHGRRQAVQQQGPMMDG